MNLKSKEQKLSLSNEKELYANLLIDQRKVSAQNIFIYRIPKNLTDQTKVGCLVLAPFGKNLERGFVLEIFAEKDTFIQKKPFEIKEIQEVITESLFPDNYLRSLKKISKFYLCSYLDFFRGVLPLGVLGSFQERVSLRDRKLSLSQVFFTQKKENNHKNIELELLEILINSSKKELSLDYLKNKLQEKPKRENLRQSLKNLERKNLVDLKQNFTFGKKVSLRKKRKEPLKNQLQKKLNLNPEQHGAYLKISKNLTEDSFKEFLLHGITGSGKTEIYFKLIEKALAQKKNVVFLVPEINLSIQLLQRIKDFFKEQEIILWHSNLSPKERLENWLKLIQADKDQPKFVLGVRSAIFAPIEKPGLIILDEEHDFSYKNNRKPFYDTRHIARIKSEENKATLVFGSATPSINCYQKNFEDNTCLTLKKRFYRAKLPEVKIVDMRKELLEGNRSIFSRALKKSLVKAVELKEQVILLLNKRGHSSSVICRDCGHVEYCQSCSVPLVFHSTDQKLRCHHCGYQKPMVKNCPKCQSPKIKNIGIGTQKLEEQTKEFLGKNCLEAEIIRVDQDTTKTHKRLKEFWSKLNEQNKEAQIILGTQMIAKGIDLERLNLVGVVNSEAGLFLPDYTASERTFSLLTQVAGRAGRREKQGEVIFQTYTPENKIISYAKEQNYLDFFEHETKKRKSFSYPPFNSLIRIIFSHTKEEKLIEEIRDFSLNFKNYIELKSLDKKDFLIIMGPAPSPVLKLHDKFRWHLLLKIKDSILENKIKDYLSSFSDSFLEKNHYKSTISLDLNPVSLI